MAERFVTLTKNTETMVSENCPVVILGYALLRDTSKNKKILQIKLQNIGQKVIDKCRIKASDEENEEAASFLFENLNIKEDDIFGSKQPIELSEETADTIHPYIDFIQFDDSTEFHGSGGWTAIPEFKELFPDDAQLASQYREEIGEDGKFTPNFENGFFQCTCGTLSIGETCRKCKRTFDDESEILFDLDGLRDRAKARELKAEEEKKALEEKAQKEEIEKQAVKKKKKRKTIITLFVCLLILLGAGVFSYFKFLKPANDYKQAENHVLQGQYDAAKNIFLSLGDYNDSPSYATYCQGFLEMSAGNYQDAVKSFDSISGFKDSADLAKEASYQNGLQMLESNELDSAYKVFTQLENYNDSPTMLQEIDYRRATTFLENNKYDDAASAFEALGDYKDSSSMAKESLYQKALSLSKQTTNFMNMYDAFNIFTQIPDYSDAKSKADKTLESLVNLHLSDGYSSYSFPKVTDNNQRLIMYNCVVAYINKNIDLSFIEWQDCFYNNKSHSYSRARTIFTILEQLPAGFEDRDELLSFFKAVENHSGDFSDFYKNNKRAIDDVWDTALRENVMNEEWILIGFLEGHWTTYNGSYYFDMTKKDDRSYSFLTSLPMVSQPSGTKYFGISNYILTWNTDDRKELAKVFDFTMNKPDEIDVFCYQDGWTYTLYRH